MSSLIHSADDDLLTYLKWLETDWNFDATMKDQIQTLRLKLGFLNIVRKSSWNRSIQDKNLVAPLKRIGTVVQQVYLDLRRFASILSSISSEGDSKMPTNLGNKISRMLRNIEAIEPELKDVYQKVKGSSRSFTTMTSEEVVTLVETLLEHLKDLLTCKAEMIVPMRKQIEGLAEMVSFLRNFVWFTGRRSSGVVKLKDLLIHTEGVAENAACLLYFCLSCSKSEEDMARKLKKKLDKLIRKIKPCHQEVREIYKASVRDLPPQHSPLMNESVLDFVDFLLNNLMELSKDKANSLAIQEDQLEALNEELKLLRYYIMDPWSNCQTHNDSLDFQLRKAENVIFRAAYFIFSLYDDKMDTSLAKELNLDLSNLLEEIECIKEQTKDIYEKLFPKSTNPNFPRTNELGFVDFLIQYLQDLRKCKPDSIALLEFHVVTIRRELDSLKKTLSEIREQFNEHDTLKNILARFRDMAYQAEYVIDSFLVGNGPLLHHRLVLCEVIQEIKLLKKKVGELSKEKADKEKEKFNDQLIGFKDEVESIKERLTRGSMKLQIISIAGMPGIGKTMLANSLYKDQSINFHFHVRAWCHVSRVYQKQNLLHEILLQVTGQTDQNPKMNNEDLEEKLRKSLKGNRYLIVLDDMWDIGAWNDLSACFPDDGNGSRILLTSRIHDIALKAKPDSIPHSLRSFSDEESLELLKVKLFQDEEYPLELHEVVNQVAKSCKGLPLAIVLVAGLLKRTERNQESWKQIAESLVSQILDEPQQQCKTLLELCYKHLPDHLKPCFLYFGAFPEDKDIPVRKLIWLWIAEGFIQTRRADEKGPEDAAENYLNDLIGRSLVMIAKTRSMGGVKTCRVHDLLREFCSKKAEEENFLQLVNVYERFPPNDPRRHRPYRLCIHSEGQDFAKREEMHFAKPELSRSCLRSLMFFVSGNHEISRIYDVAFIRHNFKLLRVLGNIASGNLDDITLLVHLRYIAMKVSSACIPDNISNLWNLETLIVTGLDEVMLPHTIWNMTRLRHIHISRSASFDLQLCGPKLFEKPFQVENLKTLSTLSLSHGEYIGKIMRNFSGLQKLSCIFKLPGDYSRDCNRFPSLEILSQLESLKVIYHGKVLHNSGIKFPSNLKKLTLSNFRLPWHEISTIGKLANLEVLKLLDRAFEGRLWEMNEGEFLKLKFLKLESLNIGQWTAGADHLPHLERLVIHKCKQLEEIPPSLGEVDTLQKIEMSWCGPSATASARLIQEEQKASGNKQPNVTIYPLDEDVMLSSYGRKNKSWADYPMSELSGAEEP